MSDPKQQAQAPPARYDDLNALIVNCTLKHSPRASHTDTLLDVVRRIFGKHGVGVQSIRLVDHPVAEGVYPDMTEHGVVGARAGFDNEFTQRNTTFAAWNMLHLARLLKDAGGIPAYGNQRSLWEAGCRFDYENPEHR
jgi:hypothetical protein